MRTLTERAEEDVTLVISGNIVIIHTHIILAVMAGPAPLGIVLGLVWWCIR